jgi:hypothetical protein
MYQRAKKIQLACMTHLDQPSTRMGAMHVFSVFVVTNDEWQIHHKYVGVLVLVKVYPSVP